MTSLTQFFDLVKVKLGGNEGISQDELNSKSLEALDLYSNAPDTTQKMVASLNNLLLELADSETSSNIPTDKLDNLLKNFQNAIDFQGSEAALSSYEGLVSLVEISADIANPNTESSLPVPVISDLATNLSNAVLESVEALQDEDSAEFYESAAKIASAIASLLAEPSNPFVIASAIQVVLEESADILDVVPEVVANVKQTFESLQESIVQEVTVQVDDLKDDWKEYQESREDNADGLEGFFDEIEDAASFAYDVVFEGPEDDQSLEQPVVEDSAVV